MLPGFGLGPLAVAMGDDLGFSEAGLGIAVGYFFLMAAIGSPHGGTLCDHIGPQRSLQAASLLSAVSLAMIATVTFNYPMLLVALTVAAAGLAIAGPGTKTMVARGVPVRRHGLAFGIQASAVPLSVTLAGLAVPTIGLTLGWRWAFAIALVVPVLGFVAAPSYGPAPRRARRATGAARGLGDIDYRPLRMLGLAAAFGSAAATTMSAFYVLAATRAGMDEGTAGLVVAAASALVMGTRILVGYLADHFESGHLKLVAWLLAVSALGYLAAATGSQWMVSVGAVFALGVGWAWSGLIVHTVVRAYPDSPGAATGITSGGLNVGGVAGPFAFGLVVEWGSYAVGFVMIACCVLAAALAAEAGRRRLNRMPIPPGAIRHKF